MATCTRCEAAQEEEQIPLEDRVEYVYIGESSRTLYTRAKEHQSKYRKSAKDRAVPSTNPEDNVQGSRMWDHTYTNHGAPQLEELSIEKDYRFEAVSGHRDPLNRQIEEALRIVKARESGCMKSSA